jgi:hypothetical protein
MYEQNTEAWDTRKDTYPVICNVQTTELIYSYIFKTLAEDLCKMCYLKRVTNNIETKAPYKVSIQEASPLI